MHNRWCVMPRMYNPRISPKLSLGLVPVAAQAHAQSKFHTVHMSKRHGYCNNKALYITARVSFIEGISPKSTKRARLPVGRLHCYKAYLKTEFIHNLIVLVILDY